MTHPYLPLYVDDFEAATTHLTIEEDGLYNRLLRLCWRTPGCSIPNDAAWIARKVRMSLTDYERVSGPVIEEFFKAQRGRLFQKRLKAEYEDISRKKLARAKAGKTGGESKARKAKENFPSNASDLPTDTRAFPEPEPDTKEAKAPLVQCAKRKHVVPAGWAPNQAHVLKAQTLGLDLHEQAEAFREFEFDKPKADFDLAFHRWLRTARKFANDRPDRFTAKQSNYDAALVGSQWADQVLADRRTF